MDAVQARVIAFRASTVQARAEQARLSRELESLRTEIQDHQQAGTILTLLSEQLSQDAEKQTADLATLAFQEIFTDQNISLIAQHSVLRNQPALSLLMVDHDRGVQGEPLKAFGGGNSSLVGIVVRIITVLRRAGLSRVLIMDEPTAQVSETYSGPTAMFLRKLCGPLKNDGLGFSMLIVTHSPVLAGQSHRLYKASVGQDNYLNLEEINRV